ncbi:hypothetical protein JCM16303_006521 [Sporobolomyces ruberrimus]
MPPSPSRSRTSSPASPPLLAPQLPPPAHVPTSLPHPQLSLARDQRSSTAVSQEHAQFVDIFRPNGTHFSPTPLKTTPIVNSSSSDSARRRSETTADDTEARGRDSVVSHETVRSESRPRSASVSQLSWGSWWPFQVVEPDADSKPPVPPKKESRDEPLLSLFAGRRAVETALRDQETLANKDQIEAELLDTDLDTLRRLSVLTNTSSAGEPAIAREADDSPVWGEAIDEDKSLPPTPTGSTSTTSSLFPSLFSSTSSRSRDSSPALPAPKSLLSSFTLANPFSASASSSSSRATSPARPNSARHYTTLRGSKSDEGPTARKGEVEDMVDEADKRAVEEEAGENAEVFSILKDRYRAPKLPVVFCHGLFGFDHLNLVPTSVNPKLQFSYWVGVQEALEAMGVEVLIGRVPASASIEERAKVLSVMIGERFPGRQVNLIGHSMGGLDGRFLISRLQPTNYTVRSLTTISTPHRGSSFADYLLEDVIGTSRVPTLLSMLETLGLPGGGKAFDDLTTAKMARFNEETPDNPNVRYFSYGAEFEPTWSNVFRVPWGVVHEREGANDGLVSVDSAKWGEYQATLHNVNHLDLIGMVGKVRYGWAEWLGKPIKFKPISFFCTLAEKLADEGL